MEPVLTVVSRKLGPFEWLLLVIQSMLWGSSYIFQAIAIKEVPAATIMATRLVPGVAILLLAAWISGTRLPRGFAGWRPFLILGPLNTLIPTGLIIWGQREVPSGLAAILTATTPLVGLFVVHMLTHDEKLSVNKLVGVVIGILGVAVLVGGAAFVGTGSALLSQLAILCSTLLYSLAAVYAHRLVGEPPMRMAVGQASSALLFSIPCAIVIDQPWTLSMPSTAAIASIILMGALSSGLAAIVHFTVLRRAGPSNTFLVTLLLPLTPLILGSIFLGERLAPREYFGAVIIGLALIVIDGRALRYLGLGKW